MSDLVKGAIIIGIAIIIAIGLYIYFSPTQTCIRHYSKFNKEGSSLDYTNYCFRNRY